MTDYAALLKALVSEDEAARTNALSMFLQQDEEAVAPLIDQFYAGVNENIGLAILEIVGEIGGYEALSLLEDVYHFSARFESWRLTAEKWLRHENRL